MKKSLLFVLLAAATMSLSAQEKEGKVYTVETNRFGSNWFISVGGGVQATIGDNYKDAGIGNLISPALDINVGKWFTPVLGLRMSYNGFNSIGATRDANGMYVDNGDTFEPGLYKRTYGFHNVHGDVMVDLMNLFGGYNEKRVYSLIPYLGAGVAFNGDEKNLGVNAGLVNRFRLSSAWDLNVELRSLIMKNAFGGQSKEGVAGATIGFTYKFNKRGFKGISTIPMVPESQLNDMRDRMNALQGENEALKRDLVDARNKKPEVVVEKEVVTSVPRLVVVFSIGKSNVDKGEYMNIETVAKAIKANSGKTYTVTGYADKATGSAEYNMKLSKKRAEAVRDVLTNEFGVSASQLKVDYKGGVDNMFYNDAKLSRVAIVEE